jgi:hypothetical protein
MAKFLTSIANGWYWHKSKKFYFERDYKLALLSLMKINIENVYIDIFVKYLALRGTLEILNDEFSKASTSFDLFFETLNKVNNYNADEVNYLKAYVAENYIGFQEVENSLTTMKFLEACLNYSLINENNVRIEILELFPLDKLGRI